MTNKNRFQILIEFFMLTIGSIIAAFAIEEFLVPNTILDGVISTDLDGALFNVN